MNLTQYFIEYYDQSPLIIKMAWILSGIILLFTVIFIIQLKYLRLYLRISHKIESRYQAKYEQYLISYLYSDEEGNTLSPKQKKIAELFKGIIKKRSKRKIVIATLLKLKSEISGEMEESIDRLYLHCGLVNYTLEYLRSKKWYVIKTGIRELTLFNVKKAQKVVMGNLNHPKQEVRKEMQLYLVKLFHFKGLDFLNTLETPLSEWDQIQLLEILKNINGQDTLEIKTWLKSQNDSVVIFTLHLAKIFNLFDEKDELIGLLNHPNEKIRVTVIHTLNHFFIMEAKEILTSSFNSRTPEEQKAILKMMENIPDTDDEAILLKNIHNENFEIKVLARKILRDLNLEKFELPRPQTTQNVNPIVICSP